MNKAVFIDKDGTLLENVPYNVDPGLVRYTDGAEEGIRILYNAGYRIMIVTNQGGVASGLISEQELVVLRHHIEQHLSTVGVFLTDFYYCPHLPYAAIESYCLDCPCRKPRPGMLLRAFEQYGLDLSKSWMIGDTLDDIECGHRAGCKTILMNTGGETLWHFTQARTPEYAVNSLKEAARIILACGKG